MENQTLPPEIWLEIFEWATFNSFLTDYTPFQNIPGDSRDPSLHIKSTLSLVCRSWRQWSTHLLYKEIRIRHGAHALKQALGRNIQDDRLYGSLVRDLVTSFLFIHSLICISYVLPSMMHGLITSRSAVWFFRTRARHPVTLSR